MFGLINAQNWGWLAGTTLGVHRGGPGGDRGFRRDRTAQRRAAAADASVREPVVVDRHRRRASINFFALFGALFFMTLYLQNVHGFSPFAAGVRTLPLSLALMVSAPLSGFITETIRAAAGDGGGARRGRGGAVPADLAADRFRIRLAVAGVRVARCRHRTGPDGQLRRDRRQRQRGRRRRGGRPAEHGSAAGWRAGHDDPGLGAEQPGGLGAVRRAHRGGNTGAGRGQAGTCQGTHRPGRGAVDSGSAARCRPRSHRAATPPS